MKLGPIIAAILISMTVSADAQSRPSRAEFLFRHADVNNDDVLDEREFRIISGSGAGLAAGKDINHQFKAADINGDGVVDLDEFQAWLAIRDR